MCVCVSIMINWSTPRLSHAITIHYGSRGFKVKMNGSSSTRGVHISSFFCFPSPLFFPWDLSLFCPAPIAGGTFCHCLQCIMSHGDFGGKKQKRGNLYHPSFSIISLRDFNQKPGFHCILTANTETHCQEFHQLVYIFFLLIILRFNDGV